MDVALVLGARGFLGRHVVAALRAAPGLQVVESDVPERVAGEIDPAPLNLVETTPQAIAAVIAERGATIVVNCSGRTAGSEAELRAANVETAARLLAAIERLPSRPRLIHIGSAAEYGPAPFGVVVREDAETAPVSPYGATKLAATRLVCEAGAHGSVEALVLRVFNAVGPGMPEGTLTGRAVGEFRRAVESGASEIQMGPLQAVRDFVDVRDIGTAVAAACLTRWSGEPLVNVGTGRAHSALQLVQALADRFGYQGSIAERALGSERSNDVPWMVADVALADRMLGWRAAHDLGSIADAVAAAG